MKDGSADSGVLGQFLRFGVTGGLSTVVYVVIYWPLATYVVHPVAAVVIAFLVAASVGYPLHSRWSFRGHGRRDKNGRGQVKFLIVQSTGMLLNAVFTWILTGPLFHGPTWWPLVPAVLITPFVTFFFNRRWVFG
jgi:putative flippase GtrA